MQLPWHLFDEPNDSLERALARETLASERARVTVLVAFLAITLGMFLIAGLNIQRAYPNFSMASWIGLGVPLVGVALAYTFGVRTLFGYLLKTNRQPPLALRYINALTETSFPSLMILLFAQWVPPPDALLSPPMLLYFLLIILSILRLNAALSIFTGFVACTEYAALAWYYREQIEAAQGTLLNAVFFTYLGRGAIFLGAGVVAGFIGVQLRNRFVSNARSLEERARLLNIFGQHLSPAVVNKLLDQKAEIESEIRTVCVMFLDIRDFSTYAEGQSPEVVVGYLNQLFGFMIERINANHGIINKFLGDGFMAIFGAPLSDGQDCRHAVTAALEIIAYLERLLAEGAIPPTRVGIGIHTGQAVTGTVGSAVRKEYTVIGDVVNVAARIEQLNKELGSQLLISEAVWEALGEDRLEAEALAPVQVKGRQRPVKIVKLA